MAEPKIYTKNYITRDCVITVSHGDGSKAYLYDRDQDSKWITSGANSDATDISIQIDFYEGTVAQNRTITRLFLLNHNLKTWDAEYWDGSAWQALTSETTDAASDTYKTFNSVTTAKIRLSCTATQTTNQEKYIGELIACALTLDIGRDLEQYDMKYREKVKEIALGDGSSHMAVTRFSPNRTQKYGANVRLIYLSAATVALLQAIKEAGEPFLWQPESTTVPSDIFFVHWAGPFDVHYVTTYKGAGYTLSAALREV